MSLCKYCGHDALVCGPNTIQLGNGQLFKRSMEDGKFYPHGSEEQNNRMIDD